MFNFGSEASYGDSNGNSFAEARDLLNTGPPLIFPDPFRRMP